MRTTQFLAGLILVAWFSPAALRAQDADVEVQVVDAMNKVFGAHPGFRAIHAKGVLVKGRFKGAPDAAALSRVQPHQHNCRAELPVPGSPEVEIS